MEEYVNGLVAWDTIIPPHWEVCRFRQIFSFGRGINITKADLQDEGLPCVTYGDIHSRFGFELKPEIHTLRCVDTSFATSNPASMLHYGDFIFADTSEDVAGSGNFTYLNSEVPTIAGYHTVVARPHLSNLSRFLAYVFDSVTFRAQVGSNVYGIKVFSITQSILKNTRFPMPPLDEQAYLVAYLDRRTAEIDSLLINLQSQAEMLDRYKRELIAGAVTKGLDKSAAVKDSGVDWIGDAPSHWGITKIKWMFEIVKRIYGKEDRDVLSITQRGLKVKDIQSNDGQLAESYANYQMVNFNDFAMNSMDLLTGWVDCSSFEGVTSPDYRVFRFLPGKEQCHNYYKYLFQMCYKNRIFYRLGQGVSNLGRWRLQADQFLNMRFPQPPIEEQAKIAAYLDAKTAQVEDLIADISEQIEKLKQYRQIVIHDAITGKIKITEG
ncbi:restriction endonuclease subunit S [uncultured Sphaerochaeta sp.]|uniref:restriction endonuclease subunit S n=1 Tax=uncultured Sphaerochaeta sp. TaxID=886478 RepID=UPI002A0A47C4|nr:restriction endonuclease subunit S [uncultured Sphaerochaeta sp.]